MNKAELLEEAELPERIKTEVLEEAELPERIKAELLEEAELPERIQQICQREFNRFAGRGRVA